MLFFQYLALGMMRIRAPSNLGSILMMYLRAYVSVTLRNVAVTSRRNVANQSSYAICDRPCGKGPQLGNFNFEIRRWTAKPANFLLFYFFRSGDAEGFIEPSQLFQSC